MWERLRRFSALERPARGLFLRAMALLPADRPEFAMARLPCHAGGTAAIPFKPQ